MRFKLMVSQDKVSPTRAKVRVKPKAINKGRVLLAPIELPSKMGSNGKMHGAPTVSIPAKIAKMISIIFILLIGLCFELQRIAL